MSAIEFSCDVCKEQIPLHEGSIYIPSPDIKRAEASRDAIREEFSTTLPGGGRSYNVADLLRTPDTTAGWTIAHNKCTPEDLDVAYYIDLDNIDAHEKALKRTAHLMRKPWLQYTNWHAIIDVITA